MIIKILRGWIIILLINWENIHFITILIGAVVYIVYGTIYYSVILSNKKGIQSKGPFKYIYSVIIAFVISFFMALITQASGTESILGGLTIGLMMGLFISFVYIKNALFGLLSRKSLFIAVGDHLIIFTILGAIHGF